MILCMGEKKRIFEDNIAVIVLSGAFNRDFKELFLKIVSEKKKWRLVRKKANTSTLDV